MGAEIKDEPQIPTKPKTEETPTVFGDPESYEHLPMEERKAMTERMKTRLMGNTTLRRLAGEKKDA